MDESRVKYTTKPTKFSPFQDVSLNKIRDKNYVDLIPSRVCRKLINNFWVQSQVKQNKRTDLKKGGESKNKKIVANG